MLPMSLKLFLLLFSVFIFYEWAKVEWKSFYYLSFINIHGRFVDFASVEKKGGTYFHDTRNNHSFICICGV